jgi:hypothetical protein
MATKLTKPLVRDTGLERDGKPVTVTLVPTDIGGMIVFKQKGGRGKGVEIPLMKLLDGAVGTVKRTPVKGTAELADNVDMSTLEARIMIDGSDEWTPAIKGRFWSIIREMREERREDMGLPPLMRGSKRNRDAAIKDDS